MSEVVCPRKRVSENRRMSILPRYAGKHFLTMERLIYTVMREYCATYSGGSWTMWEIPGGFVMTPDLPGTLQMCHGENYYEGAMSADAAGITACLIAFNRMAWHTREDRFSDLYHALREWAFDHPESAEITRAID